jgi:hypothetical protein
VVSKGMVLRLSWKPGPRTASIVRSWECIAGAGVVMLLFTGILSPSVQLSGTGRGA